MLKTYEMTAGQEAALLEMQKALAAKMQALVAEALAGHQAQLASKVAGMSPAPAPSP